MTAVLLARVHDFGGEAAVSRVLALAGSRRTPSELRDLSNWISYDEAVALWRAGAMVTHHPQFPRALGEDAARRLNSSPVATLLHSLGSPEELYAQIATTATKYSTVVDMRAVDCGPGFAEIVAIPLKGFACVAEHCAWTSGLLSQPTVLFGLGPARVEHERCAAFGAAACEYRVTWTADQPSAGGASTEQIAMLRAQLDAMHERLQGMFEAAADLISAGELEDVLARITKRAAIEVRALRYLLAVRMSPETSPQYHHQGFPEAEVAGYADRILGANPAELPDSWLVVPVASNRHDYGRLLAMHDEGVRFFPQERELLEVYARFAASALDSAAGLLEAQRRYGQSSALLELARALAAAGTSDEVAGRLAESVPVVVDCDCVGVYVWDAERGELIRRALTHVSGAPPAASAEREAWKPRPGGTLAALLRDPDPEPLFIDGEHGNPATAGLLASFGYRTAIVVPLATPGKLLGLLAVAVSERPERLEPVPDLLDRLSGVAAQATTALQNGQLVDQITYQALHDQLTGLPNRVQFTAELYAAVERARQRSELVTLVYVDLDRFKPVNDEYGHDVGDALLAAASRRLAACTRTGDMVARLGGDEFAVLVTAQQAGHVDRLADRIGAAFGDPFMVAGHCVELGISVGRSVYPVDADDADALLRLADAAMFAVKRSPAHPPAAIGLRQSPS